VRHRRLKNLSKGYRQRVGLAQALIGYPPVLLLDEPTSGLDPVQIIEIRRLIKELGRDHTIILSSHILPEIQALCDHVVVIDHGTVVADGTPDELSKSLDTYDSVLARIKAPRDGLADAVRGLEGVSDAILLPTVETGACDIEIRTSTDIRSALFELCISKGWQILELKKASASLEDIFMRLVTKEEQNGEGGADEGNIQA
jgi:ABC-2 type transport system ATP-binding protein